MPFSSGELLRHIRAKTGRKVARHILQYHIDAGHIDQAESSFSGRFVWSDAEADRVVRFVTAHGLGKVVRDA